MDLFHVTKFPWAADDLKSREQSFGVVVATFAEFRRNLKDYPFPVKATNEEKIAVQKCLLGIARRMKRKWARMDSDEVTLENALVSHIIDLSFLYDPDGRKKVYGTDDGKTYMTLNDVDHLRVKMFRPGNEPMGNLWADLSEIDDFFAANAVFSVHPQFGYMTSNPQNAGTGVTFSAVLHIPLIDCEQGVSMLENAFRALGFSLKPFYDLPFPIKKGARNLEASVLDEEDRKRMNEKTKKTDKKDSDDAVECPEDEDIMELDPDFLPEERPSSAGGFYLLTNQVSMGESEDALAARFSMCLAIVEEEEHKAMMRQTERHPDLFIGTCTKDIASLCYGSIHPVQSVLNSLVGLTIAVRMNYLPLEKYSVDLNYLLFIGVSVAFPQLYFTDSNDKIHVMNLRDRADKIKQHLETAGVKAALNSPLFNLPE